jgi:hypothetical protein
MNVSHTLYVLAVGGLPLFVLSFSMVSWALRTRRLSGNSVKALQVSMQALGAAQKDKKQRQQLDPAMHQWLRFGGGFYGLVAIYTWLLIQWDDVLTFFSGIWDLVFDLSIGVLINLFVRLLIDSFVNFGLAIAWPAYWLAADRNPWLLLLAAYCGYWLGIKAARMLFAGSADTGSDN